MRKLVIYRLVENKDGRKEKSLLRSVNLDRSFLGFGKYGNPITQECKALADALEPGNNGYYLA